MRDRHDGEPTQLAEACNRLHDEGGVGRVERGGGLVEEQGLGVAQERARDGHALLLPARQGGRVAIEELRVEAHLFHRGGEARFREIARRAGGADLRLPRTVPSKSTGVCITSAARWRRSRESSERMSRPSKRTWPPLAPRDG